MEVPVPRKNPKRSNKSQDLYCLVREPHWSYNSGPQLLSQHNSLGKDQSKFNLTIFFPLKKKCENTMFQIYCIGITKAGTSFIFLFFKKISKNKACQKVFFLNRENARFCVLPHCIWSSDRNWYVQALHPSFIYSWFIAWVLTN